MSGVVTGFANKGPQDSASNTPYSVGPQLFDPSLYSGGGGHSYVDGLVATPGGGQANATALTQSINRVTTSRGTADSVALPAAIGGQLVVVRNAAPVNGITVYSAPGSADLINNAAGSAGVVLPAMTTAMFCSMPGRWFWLLSA